MKKQKDSDHRQEVRAALVSLMSRLKPSGVEFLDIRGTASCRIGQPCWSESKEKRALRARQEMGVFWMLDDAGSVVVKQSETPDLHAWESRLASEGYECLNQRVGDWGVLHVFLRKEAGDQHPANHPALEKAADEIERLLNH